MDCLLPGCEAKGLLDEYVRAWDPSKKGSSSGKPTKSCKDVKARARSATWRDCPNISLFQERRSQGQLRAYVDLAGARFGAVAIRCKDGFFIQPDMQVMKSFCRAGAVLFREGGLDPFASVFELTDLGRRMIGLLPPQHRK